MPEKKDVAIGILIAGLVAAYAISRLMRESGGPKAPEEQPLDLTLINKVVDDLVAKLKLRPREQGESGKTDRHRVFFLHRRARSLSIADARFREDQGLEALKQRIRLEFDQVNKFLEEKLGTPTSRGPYFGGPEGPEAKAHHLDLGKYVSPRDDDPPPTTETEAVTSASPSVSQASTLRELDRRRMRVIGIVWRAAAIDSDLWKITESSSKLESAELTEILDRRLRSVERLQYEASAGATPDGIGSSSIERRWQWGNQNVEVTVDANGDPVVHPPIWRDDYKVRMFEAPSIPRTAKESFWKVEDLNTSGDVVTDAGTPRFELGSHLRWYQNHTTDEFDWNKWPGTRLPDPRPLFPLMGEVPNQWTLAPSSGEKRGYGWVMKKEDGRRLPADIIRNLFVSSRDWWQRTWLHADGVMSALHLEALQFAKLRRKDDELFNALPARFSLALDDYFEVRPRLARAPNGIMRPGRTVHFENAAIPWDDLQIGDQVLLEVSPVLSALGSAAWEYPTVLVTEIDTFPNDPSLNLKQLKIQGFGTANLEYPAFQTLLGKTVESTLKRVNEFIALEIDRLRAAAVSAGQPFTPPMKLKWDTGLVNQADLTSNDVSILRLWNPYGDQWDDPGPWWIWINLLAPMWHGVFFGDVVRTLSQTPGGIVWIANDKLLPEFQGRAEVLATIPIGPGFHHPPWQSSVGDADPRQTIFVPLAQPDVGWMSYFDAKAADANAKFSPRLTPVQLDAAWLPGLKKRSSGKIPAIRPRVDL